MLPLVSLTDREFVEIIKRRNIDEERAINWMVDTGWKIGRTEDGQNEFFPPDSNENIGRVPLYSLNNLRALEVKTRSLTTGKEKLSVKYYEIREVVKSLVPRKTKLLRLDHAVHAVKEKGRKGNYKQFDLLKDDMLIHERLLDTENIRSFFEISLRAAYCPMPFNADVWDGLRCPYRCRYCVPSGTKIKMEDGSEKNVERVKVGDRILSYNTETDEPEIATVEETMSRKAKEVLVLETDEGELRLTPEHPVWTKRGWVKAGQLTCDDEVLIW